MKRKIRSALYGFLVLALLLWAAPALAVPPIPHAFYGTVTINGTDAPVGTVVNAKINGEAAGSYTTTVVGQYGSLAERDYLAVGNTNANDGDAITFYVDSISTGQTATFETGSGPTEKNLALTITDESITGEVEESIAAGQTGIQVNATNIADTTITVSTLPGRGAVTVRVKKYHRNPHPTVTPPASMVPKYCDIEVVNPAAVSWPMYVEQTYTDAEVAELVESSLGLYYYKAADNAWHRCSDTDVNTAENYVWANMTQAELSGSPVAIGGAVVPAPEEEAPAPPVGGGGEGAPPALTTLSLTGLATTPSLQVDAAGIVQSTCQLTTADGKLTLAIAVNTKLLDSIGNALSSLVAAVEPSPPASPAGKVIVTAYDLGPDGATFSPPITLTMKYDPETLPEGCAEDDLCISYWDGEKCCDLETTCDVEADKVSCQVSHFTTFAVIAPAALPLPAPAAFVTTDLSITPAEVEPNEAVTISVSVANTGDIEGSYTVVLMINGATEAEESVTIAAGDSQSVSFSVTKEDAGSYSVTIDDLSGTFVVTEVTPPPTPINWWLLGGIIAAYIIICLIIWRVVASRRY